MLLKDRINEQQQMLPYTLVYKLFLSSPFGDFINKCAALMVDGAITKALEMVKKDYSDVNVA